MSLEEQLRGLPSVDEIAAGLSDLETRFPRKLIVAETRRVLAAARDEFKRGLTHNSTSIAERVRTSLEVLERPSLRPVINATGVVLHTNLGRAPLPRFEPISGYSNLEYDIEAGRRGKRDVHASGLLDRLVGAPGIAVNNNAAAVFLALNELAAGFEVVVSRGELIEIGDGFRIPDIMQRSGAILREVGTTNRTRVEDYRDAIGDRTRLLLRVHPSNFRIQGFTGKPEARELAALAKERGIPLYEDLGSGCVADLRPWGVDEPLVADSLRAGANLVSFSGDKLLGGPQAGLLVGDPALIARLRRNPMFRALRLDKLIYQALETTLRNLLLERWNCIPAFRLISLSVDEIRIRAERLVSLLPEIRADIIPGESIIGGGSTPEQSLDTWLISIQSQDVVELEARCRRSEPPLIARVQGDRLILDLRTVFEEEEPVLIHTLRAAFKRSARQANGAE